MKKFVMSEEAKKTTEGDTDTATTTSQSGEKEMQGKTVDNLREELETLKVNLSRCQAELASERADRLVVPPVGADKVPPRHLGNSLGPGQLPDINPDSVSVIRKETHGKNGAGCEMSSVLSLSPQS